MSYATAAAGSNRPPEEVAGEATHLSRNNLSRIDKLSGRLQRLIERVRGAEPRGIEGIRENGGPLVRTLQQTDGALDGMSALLDILEGAI